MDIGNYLDIPLVERIEDDLSEAQVVTFKNRDGRSCVAVRQRNGRWSMYSRYDGEFVSRALAVLVSKGHSLLTLLKRRGVKRNG